MEDDPKIRESQATISAKQKMQETMQFTDETEIAMRKSWLQAEAQIREVEYSSSEFGYFENNNYSEFETCFTIEKAQQNLADWIHAAGIESVARGNWERSKGEDYGLISKSLQLPQANWEELVKTVNETGINVRNGRVWRRERDKSNFSSDYRRNKKLERTGIVALPSLLIFALVGEQTIYRLKLEVSIAVSFLIFIYFKKVTTNREWLRDQLQNPILHEEKDLLEKNIYNAKYTKWLNRYKSFKESLPLTGLFLAVYIPIRSLSVFWFPDFFFPETKDWKLSPSGPIFWRIFGDLTREVIMAAFALLPVIGLILGIQKIFSIVFSALRGDKNLSNKKHR